MIRIIRPVANFRKQPESRGNTIRDRNLKRECITLSPPFIGKGLVRVIHRILVVTGYCHAGNEQTK